MFVSSLRLIGAVAILLAVLVLAACGTDPTPEPTATPTPEPTATPTPVPEALMIAPDTTGLDLVASLSEAEAACLSSAMGDANFQLFQGAPLLATAANESAYGLFSNCLERDNLLVLGIGLMGVNLGGWSDEALECATGLAQVHPEFVYLALGVADQVSDPTHPGEVHGILLDLYGCLDTTEQVGFVVSMMAGSLETAPFSGQQMLEALPESEVDCLQAALPEPVFAMIASAPSVAAGELRSESASPQILECISAESIIRISGEVMANGLYADSEESHSCIVEFALEHSHYIDLVRQYSEQSETLAAEDFLEIAEDGFKVFSCLTDDELAQFQIAHTQNLVP